MRADDLVTYARALGGFVFSLACAFGWSVDGLTKSNQSETVVPCVRYYEPA